MIPIRDDTPRFSNPFVTYFIIALNTLVFLFELSVSEQGRGALNGLIYHFGVVPWRFDHIVAAWPASSLTGLFLPILTSMFLHASWLHLIGNMWFLWIFGDNIEDYLGHFSYLLFYLVCGLAAAITHILLNAGSRLPSVGASGAIAGVMGAYFVLYPHSRILTLIPLFLFYMKMFEVPAVIFLGLWFAMQFLSATAVAGAESGGVAVWAHVAGFLAGAEDQHPARATWD